MCSEKKYKNDGGISIEDLVNYVYDKVNDNETNIGLRQLFDALKDPESETISMHTFIKLAKEYGDEEGEEEEDDEEEIKEEIKEEKKIEKKAKLFEENNKKNNIMYPFRPNISCKNLNYVFFSDNYFKDQMNNDSNKIFISRLIKGRKEENKKFSYENSLRKNNKNNKNVMFNAYNKEINDILDDSSSDLDKQNSKSEKKEKKDKNELNSINNILNNNNNEISEILIAIFHEYRSFSQDREEDHFKIFNFVQCSQINNTIDFIILTNSANRNTRILGKSIVLKTSK